MPDADWRDINNTSREGQVNKILTIFPDGFLTTVRWEYVAMKFNYPGNSLNTQRGFVEAYKRRKIIPLVINTRRLGDDGAVSQSYKMAKFRDPLYFDFTQDQIHELIGIGFRVHKVVIRFTQHQLSQFQTERSALVNQSYLLSRGSLRFSPCLETGQVINPTEFGELEIRNRNLTPFREGPIKLFYPGFDIELSLRNLDEQAAGASLTRWFDSRVKT